MTLEAEENKCTHFDLIQDVSPGAERLRRVSCHRRYVGESADVSVLWQHRMLRRFKEHTRNEAFPRDATSCYEIISTWRGLDVVLCGSDY